MNADPSPSHSPDPSDSGLALGKGVLHTDSRYKDGKPKAWQPPSAEELQAMLPGYEVQKFIARGGMGAVYRGVQTSLGRVVAIKILPPALQEGDHNYAERFKQEARAMGQLNHPAIVAVYESGEMPDGTLYFVMEFVEGTDVAQMVAAQGRLPSAHAMAITAHVCDALQYAHDHGVVHRDIKPANIMVSYDGRVKVADFGLAKLDKSGEMGLTKSGMVMGTLHFMAPEAMALGSAVDHRADIYAVGVMLYQMLTGKLPQGLFEMPSLQVPGLDPRYDTIISHALRESRELRYSQIREMRAALDGIMTQPVAKADVAVTETPAALPTGARPQRPPQPMQSALSPRVGQAPRPRQSSSQTWIIAGSLCAVLVVAAWLASQQQQQQPTTTAASNKAPAPTPSATLTPTTPEPAMTLVQSKSDPVPTPSNPLTLPKPSPATTPEPTAVPQRIPDLPRSQGSTLVPRLAERQRVLLERGGRIKAWGHYELSAGRGPMDVSSLAQHRNLVAVVMAGSGGFAVARNGAGFGFASDPSKARSYANARLLNRDNRPSISDSTGIFALPRTRPVLPADPALRALAPLTYIDFGLATLSSTGEFKWQHARGADPALAAQAEPPPAALTQPQGLIDIVSTGTRLLFHKQDGTVEGWDPVKLWERKGKGPPEGEVVTFSQPLTSIAQVAGGSLVAYLLRTDGSLLKVDQAGKVSHLSGQTGPYVAVRGGVRACVAQRPDGTWQAFETDAALAAKVASVGPALDMDMGFERSREDGSLLVNFLVWIEPDEDPAIEQLLESKKKAIAAKVEPIVNAKFKTLLPAYQAALDALVKTEPSTAAAVTAEQARLRSTASEPPEPAGGTPARLATLQKQLRAHLAAVRAPLLAPLEATYEAELTRIRSAPAEVASKTKTSTPAPPTPQSQTPAPAAPLPPGMTEWIDINQRRIVAKFRDLKGSQVELEMAGSIIKLPLTTLSAASQKQARDLLRAAPVPPEKQRVFTFGPKLETFPIKSFRAAKPWIEFDCTFSSTTDGECRLFFPYSSGDPNGMIVHLLQEADKVGLSVTENVRTNSGRPFREVLTDQLTEELERIPLEGNGKDVRMAVGVWDNKVAFAHGSRVLYASIPRGVSAFGLAVMGKQCRFALDSRSFEASKGSTSNWPPTMGVLAGELDKINGLTVVSLDRAIEVPKGATVAVSQLGTRVKIEGFTSGKEFELTVKLAGGLTNRARRVITLAGLTPQFEGKITAQWDNLPPVDYEEGLDHVGYKPVTADLVLGTATVSSGNHQLKLTITPASGDPVLQLGDLRFQSLP